MDALPRPRLETKAPLYSGVADLADRLERSGRDLWAANLRACLHGESAGEVFADLGLELYRLRQSVAARRLRLEPALDALCATVEAAVGPPDHEHLPLYSTTKELADHLRLEGAGRWMRRLESAALGADASATARIAAVTAVLGEMTPGAWGLPAGTGTRVAAVRQRLVRIGDAAGAARALAAALRPLE